MDYDGAINEYNKIREEIEDVECRLRSIAQDNLHMNIVQMREIVHMLEKTQLVKNSIDAIISHEDAR